MCLVCVGYLATTDIVIATTTGQRLQLTSIGSGLLRNGCIEQSHEADVRKGSRGTAAHRSNRKCNVHTCDKAMRLHIDQPVQHDNGLPFRVF